ncbi:alpha/beta hydrolase [Phenylobacterium sp. LjRoot225]|uniref:alpha/beta hydrolase n=1 Tax=Phenylobacterium sp. LjRoot225 TaxID=3342285 RepID=UPI003ECE1CC2
MKIWPGPPPGTELNLTTPTLTIFRPRPGQANGKAVIVCPGGAFQALAFSLEGTDVAKWLADRGVTAFVLKYWVRRQSGFRLPTDLRNHPEQFDDMARLIEPGRGIAVADAIQAIRFVRANAAQYGIAPDRVGLMGFSAGAMTTMGVVMDAPRADRPNFGAPIYGAMEDKVPPKGGPPLFIVAAQDDATIPVGKRVEIFSRWTAAELPAELHIYDDVGHGSGTLARGKPVDNWPVAFDAWLRSHGWVGSKAP